MNVVPARLTSSLAAAVPTGALSAALILLLFVATGCEPGGTSDVVTGEDGKARVGPAVATATVNRAVAPGDRTLVLRGFRGTVMLEGTMGSTAELEFVKRGLGGDETEAQEHLGGIRVTEEGTAEEYVYAVEADDEDRSAADVRGSIPAGVKLRVEHAAGAVSTLGITGPIRVEHEHGPVDIRDAASSVTVEIKNGDVSVHYRSLPTTASVDLSTANGDLELAVPTDASLQLDAETSVGDVFVRGLTFDPQRLTPRRAGARYVAQHGAGDATATLRTENGSILIRAASPVQPGEAMTDTSDATTGAASSVASPDADTTTRAAEQDTNTAPSRQDDSADMAPGDDTEMPPPDSLDPPPAQPDDAPPADTSPSDTSSPGAATDTTGTNR